MFELTGKVAFVTGGNGGIGLGMAKGLARAGAGIVVAARNRRKTDDAVELIQGLGDEALGLDIDVADEASVGAAVEKAIDRFGRIDILVNNAGVNIRKPPQEYTSEQWDEIIDINLKGTFLCSKAVYPHMVRSGGGKIINIGSMTSIFGVDWASAYGASKGGVVQLARSLAVAWAKDNIQVNTILPGWITTGLTSQLQAQFPERHSLVSSRIPLGRWGEPDDLAGAAVFLSSRASDYVTGVALPVDGGYSTY
jgi:2-deoxy-D-gluconate 3-dehydrogenase